MIQSLFLNTAEQIQTNLSLDQVSNLLKKEKGLLWVNLVEEDIETCAYILKNIFGFHPLAISDALEEKHVPRVDDWGNYLYMVLHAPFIDKDLNEPLRTLELDIFLGKNFLVTYQSQKLAVVDRVWTTIQHDIRHLQQGADHLFYKLADDLIADYMPLVEEMDSIIDDIEDQIFSSPSNEMLEQIFHIKRSVLHLRRIITPQREVFNKLARGDDNVIDKKERVFFRDIYDHLVRLYDITESLRDLMSSVLDTYLSAVNNRMNEVMKTLTIITTLFMPLSFLVGFFGMNFFTPHVPLTGWLETPVFYLVLAACVLLPVFMYLWMRRRHWM